MKKLLLLSAFFAGICFASAQPVTFTNQSISTTGSERAVVDMNGDFLDDIVSISSTNVNVFYQLAAGGFDEDNIMTTPANYLPSWSLAAADYNRDGFTDLLYGAGSGVTFMRSETVGGDFDGFTEVSGPESIFSQRSNFVDINNDGNLDAFVCHDVAPNVYYINDGSGNLTFNQGGLGDYVSGGNYGSVWIDFDNDRDVDLFIAKCGGEPARRENELHLNNGDGTYTEVGAVVGLEDDMQTWSSAWADYDNDGDMDVFVGASSGVHKLMANNGDGTFTDVTAGSGVLSVTATGIENATHDINNDGFADIISNGNVLYGNGDLTFTDITFNAFPSGTGMFGDLNNDGFIDHFGGGVIKMNDTNSNNWIVINTIGTESNINGLGARVEIVTASGTQIRDVRSGEGFRFMSSLNTHFGIGSDDEIESVTIFWTSGIIDEIIDPNINETLTVVEGTFLSLEDTFVDNLIMFPNPAKDVLNLGTINDFDDPILTVFDINGRRVMHNRLEGKQVDVSGLQTGSYILRIFDNNTIKTQRFIKE